MMLGSIHRSGPLPAFLRSPSVLPAPLDVKPFLQFPMDGPQPATIGLFHNFNTMDPVQKAVMSHTFGPPMVRTKRPIISCNICQIRFNSESQAEAHYKGNRHARRVKGGDTSKTARPPPLTAPPTPPRPTSPESRPSRADDSQAGDAPNGSPSPSHQLPPPAEGAVEAHCPSFHTAAVRTPPAGPGEDRPPDMPSPASSPSGESEEEQQEQQEQQEQKEQKEQKLLYCSLCKVAVNSLSQLEAHNKGTKHKTIMEARSGLGPIKAYPPLGPKASQDQGGESDPDTQERTFHCEICNVRVNSELQLKQHISSRRHRDGVAGKPNPLLSRHKKRADFMELPKTLAAGLLANPLAVAAAMAAVSSNQLALRPAGPPTPHHHHHHHHLLQGAPLNLLRPAPGPIRTTHGPVLFSPY